MHEIEPALNLSAKELSLVLLPALFHWANRYLRYTHGCEREQSRRLWNRNNMNHLIDAHTPFFLHSKPDSRATREDIAHHTQSDRKQRTRK